MQKNKHLFFLFSVFIIIFISNFVFANNAFASPVIDSFLLNGSSQDVTFNPNNSESVSIEVKANVPVKFTRLYICSINQICDGTKGNYIRYFSQTTVSDTINKTWNGQMSSTDETLVPTGEYKIRVSMAEGTNDPVLEFGQYSIFVDFSSANSNTTNSTSSNNTNDNSTSTTNSNNNSSNAFVVNHTVYVSAHSSTEDLSNYNEKAAFEITAGRERMALIGSPLEFNAMYNLLQKDQCVPDFRWSFGDGFEAVGKNITHTYKYSGEYQVVLNGNCGEYDSISRTIVKVISPNISILSLANGDVEVINNGETEINIGGWKIIGGQKDFIFPQDTIISANNKITLSKEDIGASSSITKISFVDPTNREVAFVDNINGKQINNESFSQTGINENTVSVASSSISVAEAERLVVAYKTKLALNEQQINKTDDIKKVAVTKVVEKDLTDSKDTIQIADNKDIIQTATVLDSVNSSSTKSLWNKLIDIPIKSIKSFARLFYDF